eukprot:TRINITY_DN3183_c1_g3_i1.p1 TRINITY_DN3183_c1_g3~~TRINITY_DN3183_c1_g3_i1.p1  ORF type:complete len:372 (-),score=112.87 TRINITY_DN3183_c1_g3_i1:273-1343(-)
MNDNGKETHQLRLEVTQRIDEIHTLQNSLSDAQIGLFDALTEIEKLRQENEELKLKEIQDRRRIASLLQLTNPEPGTTYFFYDNEDETNKNIEQKQDNFEEKCYDELALSPEIQQLKINSLELHTAKLQKLLLDKEHAYILDRNTRQEQFDSLHQEHVRRLNLLSTQLRETEVALNRCTKEILKEKELHLAEIRQKDDIIEQLQLNCAHYERQIALTKAKYQANVNNLVQEVRENEEPFNNKLRKTIMEYRDEKQELVDKNERMKADNVLLVKEINKLQSALKETVLARNLIIEGFGSQLNSMSNAIRHIETTLIKTIKQDRKDDAEGVERIIRRLKLDHSKLKGVFDDIQRSINR